MLGQLLETLSGHWAVHLESRVPRTELYEARIASSKPSLGFFILLISSAVIASLGLISNSTAVVIGAMIVAPLMDPILSLAFGLAVSDGKLIRRSAVTIGFGVLAVIATAALISLGLGISHVQSEITGRTSTNLIDLGIAIAAAVAGSFSMTRKQLSNSIAGVAIAVALVQPLCVSGIGLTLGSEMVAVWPWNGGGSHQPDRGGIVSAFSGKPDRHHRHQPGGVFGAALRLIPQLLVPSSGLARLTGAAVIDIA